MAFFGLLGLGNLLVSAVLSVNAIAILSPDRFLVSHVAASAEMLSFGEPNLTHMLFQARSKHQL